MKVFEGRVQGRRAVVGIDRRYLQVCTQEISFGLLEISSFAASFSPGPVVSLETPHGRIEIEGLAKTEIQEMQEVVNTKRVVSKEDLKEITKHDIQLKQVYQNISEEEMHLFYATFGDRVIRSIKDPEINPIETLSSRKKAKFVLGNKVLMKVFFQILLPFDAFVKELFSGFIFANQPENSVDKAVLAELGRGSSSIERLNVYSFLLQASWEVTPLKKPVMSSHSASGVLNPNLVNALSDPAQASSEKMAPKLSIRTPLDAPVITPGKVDPIKRVSLPMALLRRLRETSRLVFKSKTATDLIHSTTHRLEQAFKEEIRRKYPLEQGELGISLVNRITPSRFLKAPAKEKHQSEKRPPP